MVEKSDPMNEKKRVVMDVDGVLAKKDDGPYPEKEVDDAILKRLRYYEAEGFYIVLLTARNMRTYGGRIGKINAETAPALLDWLEEKQVPYDEIHYGKPWCGFEGFYVDDRAIRPSEFLSMEYDDVLGLIEREVR